MKKVKIIIGIVVALLVISVIQAFINPAVEDTVSESISSPIAENNLNNSTVPINDTATESEEIIFQTQKTLEERTDSSENIDTTQSELNGRGISDSGRSEPMYVGVIGYIAISSEQEYVLERTDNFVETPWIILSDNGEALEHKTEIIVKSQELKHEGWGSYSGLLTVERTDTKEEVIINVKNFITKPYWTYEDLNEAAKIGYYMAEYHQIGPNYPVTRNNEKVDLEDGLKVLVIGPTGMYGGDAPDRNVNSVEGIVFKEWQLGYGGVSVFFDPQDLTIIY